MTLHKLKPTNRQTNGFTRTNSHKSLGGFTIVELMIATTVFSVILLLATFALLQVGRTYYKGITLTKTQNAARTIIDTISQDIQFSGGEVNQVPPGGLPDPQYYAICVGGNRYTVKLDQKVSGSDSHGLVLDAGSGNCDPSSRANMNAPLPAASRELLDNNMRVVELNVSNPNNNFYTINLTIIYGDTDLLNNNIGDPNYHKQCLSVQAGSQFCATVNLSATVQKRIVL